MQSSVHAEDMDKNQKTWPLVCLFTLQLPWCSDTDSYVKRFQTYRGFTLGVHFPKNFSAVMINVLS